MSRIRRPQLKLADGGFTLVELIVAMLLTTVVIAAAGSGLVTLLSANQTSEQRQGQRQELQRAMEFISDDIRSAQRVNKNAANQTVDASEALAAARSQFGMSAVPYYNSIAGTPALYLEIPVGVCAGNEVIDRVTYEVRRKRDFALNGTLTTNEKLWRGPYLIYRHGRIPRLDGEINPCSEPVISEVLVDGILNDNASEPSSCGMPSGASTADPARLSGLGGFYTCVKGVQVALLLRGNGSPNPAQLEPVTLYTMVHQRSGMAAPSASSMCNVPDIVGRGNSVAKGLVTSAGLVHNSIDEGKGTNGADIVVNQVPAANARIPCGQIVTFTYRS
jgi:prepilin-type N-terminal cleavage/methylation domain-containing protein